MKLEALLCLDILIKMESYPYQMWLIKSVWSIVFNIAFFAVSFFYFKLFCPILK